MSESTPLSGNIYEFHEKAGHSVEPYTESETNKREEDKRRLL